MQLSNQYDRFYRSDLRKERFTDLPVTGCPIDRVQAILAYAGTGERVLDVGCGNGHMLYHLRNAFQSLVGLEFSQHRLEQARINLEGLNFEAHCGSAESMVAIADSSIDCIVSADTIEHVPDVYGAMAEMFRVLKPGGRLVINTPNIALIKKRLLLLFGRFPSTSQSNEGLGSEVLFDGGHLHYFTYRSLRLVLERAGFQMLAKVGYGSLGRIHNLYPTLTSGGCQWVAMKPKA